jgi:hypothetical protein
MGIGLAAEDLAALHMTDISTRIGEHIAGYFEPGGPESWLAGIGPADIHNRDPRELPLLAAGVAAVGNGVLGRRDSGAFLQMAPWQFGNSKQPNLRRTFRRASFLLSRLLANMGVAGETPLLERFRNPVDTTRTEQRWLDGLYLDHPEEWDDPYRFFRW